jgi:glycosyltransferase involved in cell wall biosynthesis
VKINIVTVEESWALRNIAENYARALNAQISLEADMSADINFYIHYRLFKKKTNIDIGYFTHRENFDLVKQQDFDRISKDVDWCISMCDKTTKFLPKYKTTTLLPSPDLQFFKRSKLILGVVGREYQSGRKRIEWIDKIKKIPDVEVKFTNNKYKWEDMPKFYESIDYLLILSDNEGGPLPLYEALAMKKPIITSDVGSTSNFTNIQYEDLDDLIQKIQKLIIPLNTWEISANKLMKIFEKLYSNKIRHGITNTESLDVRPTSSSRIEWY